MRNYVYEKFVIKIIGLHEQDAFLGAEHMHNNMRTPRNTCFAENRAWQVTFASVMQSGGQ